MQDITEERQGKVFMRIDPNELLIREAGVSDIPVITEIYNEAVLNGVATFDTEIKSIENRLEWLRQHDTKHPVLVACIGFEIAGWASLSRWSERSAYDGTAEVSLYIHTDYRDKGIGSLLFSNLMEQAKLLGLHCLLSRITEGNDNSIRLHLRNGFSKIGVMHQVGYKFGTYLDVTLLEKIL